MATITKPIVTQDEVDALLNANKLYYELKYDADEQNNVKKTKEYIKNIGKCLDEAKTLINGDRQDDYGHPIDNFVRIMNYWNTYLYNNYKEDINQNRELLKVKDIAMMMVLFKLARLENKFTHDSCVDMAGYLGIYDYINEVTDKYTMIR